MPVASALTQKNITVGRGVTIYVDDQKINPGDSNGNPVEPMLYNGTTYLPIRAVSAALLIDFDGDGNDELLCVCNTKEKNPKGTNKRSTYMVYQWDGNNANRIVE